MEILKSTRMVKYLAVTLGIALAIVAIISLLLVAVSREGVVDSPSSWGTVITIVLMILLLFLFRVIKNKKAGREIKATAVLKRLKVPSITIFSAARLVKIEDAIKATGVTFAFLSVVYLATSYSFFGGIYPPNTLWAFVDVGYKNVWYNMEGCKAHGPAFCIDDLFNNTQYKEVEHPGRVACIRAVSLADVPNKDGKRYKRVAILNTASYNPSGEWTEFRPFNKTPTNGIATRYHSPSATKAKPVEVLIMLLPPSSVSGVERDKVCQSTSVQEVWDSLS